MKNIILIGMPGCGKSTVGRMLADRLGLDFIDLDSEIEKTAGKKIKRIFEESGEEGFRQTESKALKNAMKRKNAVIATGGGIVTVEENYSSVCGGLTVFIDRPTERIEEDVRTADRPLLADGVAVLKKLYSDRYPIYLKWANIRIVNDKDAETAVNTIIKEVYDYENNGN